METTRLTDREAKRRFWEAHLNQWESNGISQSAYCRQNHLSLHGFIYWKKKRTSPRATISLVEWPVPQPEAILYMVTAGVVKHPSEWPHCGFKEIQNPPERYRLIDRKALMQLLGIGGSADRFPNSSIDLRTTSENADPATPDPLS